MQTVRSRARARPAIFVASPGVTGLVNPIIYCRSRVPLKFLGTTYKLAVHHKSEGR